MKIGGPLLLKTIDDSSDELDLGSDDDRSQREIKIPVSHIQQHPSKVTQIERCKTESKENRKFL